MLLDQVGYQTENGGNAPTSTTSARACSTTPRWPSPRPPRRRWPSSSATPRSRQAPPGRPLSTMLRVIVGQDLPGHARAGADRRHARAAAARVSPTDRRSRPRSAATEVASDFPVMVPTVIEDGSSIDDDEGIRVYKIDESKAIRLTYHTGANEYWGIQQTGWDEPPILNEPTLERTIAGRTYKLFFSGAKLHIVAFEQDGGCLLGREHAPEQALERDDARHRQGPEAPAGLVGDGRGGDHPGRRQGRASRRGRRGTAEGAGRAWPDGRWPPTRWRSSRGPASSASSSAAPPGRSSSSSPSSPASAPRSSPCRSRSRSAAAAGSASPPPRGGRRATSIALNGDELLDVDLAALLERHREPRASPRRSR